MDLLIKLSVLKAKSVAFCMNNNKIQKHISIQKHKEHILNTVEELKVKLFNWRTFKKETLDKPKTKSVSEKD